MPAVTSSFLLSVEDRWRRIIVDDFAALVTPQNQWWQGVTKKMTTGSRREILAWILNTAALESQGPLGGSISFDDMSMEETDFTPEFVKKGLRLLKSQFEDADGNGIELGTAWMRQVTAQAAYWPQKQIANLLKSTSGVAYDGVTFWSASHRVNPKDASKGTFSNRIANVPVDVSVTVDTAVNNLYSIFGSVASIKMPNGEDPRFLRPKKILCGPKLYPRLAEITQAKYIARAAGASGGGGSDIEGIVRSIGFGEVILVPELAGFESDTTYFVVTGADGVPQDDLSGFVYLEREPFSVKFYTGQGGGDYVDAILDRADELEWHIGGRNITGYGHPYGIVKCVAGA